MAHNVEDDLARDHPLILELASLRTAVTQYQEEVHNSALKFQRHSLDTVKVNERITQLERQNALLQSELSVLRATPHPDASSHAHPAFIQAQQMSILLRQVNDKLSLTEQSLLARTSELAHATSEKLKTKHMADGAYELAARTRAREEEGKMRERDLERRIRAAEEERKMSDLVVNEYADLVRSLEGRSGTRPLNHVRSGSSSTTLGDGTSSTHPGAASTTTLVDGLAEGKFGLQKLLAEFSVESEHLHGELERLRRELDLCKVEAETERKRAEADRIDLAKARFELEKLRLDDNAAAKMVSRYMKFSQSSTDTLQVALTSLKTRHEATVNSLSEQLSQLVTQFRGSEAMVERLRDTLDELGGDLLRESYGRRREVGLRIRMTGREEKLREDFHRWILRAEEDLNRNENENSMGPIGKLLDDAKSLLSTLDGSITSSEDNSSGAVARIISAEVAVEFLAQELQAETTRRVELERALVQSSFPSQLPIPSVQSAPISQPPSPPPKDRSTVSTPTLIFAQDTVKPMASDPAMQETPTTSTSSLSPTIDLTKAEEQRSAILTPTSPTVQSDMALTNEADPYDGLSEHTEPSNTPSLDPPQPLPQLDIPSIPTNPAPESLSPDTNPTPDLLPMLTIETVSLPVSSFEEDVNTHSSGGALAPLVTPEVQVPADEPERSPVIEIIPVPATPEIVRHPLLSELSRVSSRYDNLQRAFRDCHHALEALKQDLSHNATGSSSAPTTQSTISPETIRTALQRLDDYTEDARVELEIRKADEALLARGYETLLSVPGAVSSISPSTPTRGSNLFDENIPSRSDVERQVDAFVDGTDPGVQKAQQTLTRKLDDVQHDIAALKRYIHNPEPSLLIDAPGDATDLATNAPSIVTPPTNLNTWTSWIRNSPSRPLSTLPGNGPPPTFGNVMTTPRLRHSPSLNFPGRQTKPNPDSKNDPFVALGLKVPMPTYVPPAAQPVIEPQTPTRNRTVSTMYMIGLGSRSASGPFATPPRPRALSAMVLKEPSNEREDADVE